MTPDRLTFVQVADYELDQLPEWVDVYDAFDKLQAERDAGAGDGCDCPFCRDIRLKLEEGRRGTLFRQVTLGKCLTSETFTPFQPSSIPSENWSGIANLLSIGRARA